MKLSRELIVVDEATAAATVEVIAAAVVIAAAIGTNANRAGKKRYWKKGKGKKGNRETPRLLRLFLPFPRLPFSHFISSLPV